MKQVFKIDIDGFLIEPVIIPDNEGIPNDCVDVFPTQGLYKHKWNGSAWEEGLTQAEVDEIKNAPVQPSEFEILKKQQADLTFTLMLNGVI